MDFNTEKIYRDIVEKFYEKPSSIIIPGTMAKRLEKLMGKKKFKAWLKDEL